MNILRYRERGSKENNVLTASITDDYGNIVICDASSPVVQAFFIPKSDWHEVLSDNPAPVIAPKYDTGLRGPIVDPAFHPERKIPWKSSEAYKIPVTCAYSGLNIGEYYPAPGLLGRTPYVVAWKKTAFLHPIFSVPLSELLHVAEAKWNLEKSGTRQFPMQDKQLIFLAMLHASGLIQQDVAGLPSARIVETYFIEMMQFLGWRKDHGGDRLHFPRLHVWLGADKENKGNLFASVPYWLDVCATCKDEYETVSRERLSKAKAAARDLALKSIRKSMYADVSVRRLWNWAKVQIPQMVLENNPDLEQLFFVAEDQIHLWQKEDIEALEDLILTHCELGNSISHEVNKHIRKLADWRATYYDTFEIVVEADLFPEYKGQPAPVAGNFANRAAYLAATAKWKLANRENTQQKKEDDI